MSRSGSTSRAVPAPPLPPASRFAQLGWSNACLNAMNHRRHCLVKVKAIVLEYSVNLQFEFIRKLSWTSGSCSWWMWSLSWFEYTIMRSKCGWSSGSRMGICRQNGDLDLNRGLDPDRDRENRLLDRDRDLNRDRLENDRERNLWNLRGDFTNRWNRDVDLRVRDRDRDRARFSRFIGVCVSTIGWYSSCP